MSVFSHWEAPHIRVWILVSSLSYLLANSSLTYCPGQSRLPPTLALCQTLTLAGKQKAACCPPWMSPSLGSMNKSAGMLQESKAIIFPPKGKNTHTTLSWLCPSENTPGLLRVWPSGSKCAPNRTSEVNSFCLSIPPCLPQGRQGRMPCRLRCRSGI